MEITENEVDWNLPVSDFEKITIIPTSYAQKTDKEYYNDTASSFYKFVKDKSDIQIYSSPDIFLAQKSNDWFGPVIYVGTLAIENYSTLITLLDLISDYLESKYAGNEVNAKFEIVSKDKKKGTYKSVKYDGPSSGVRTVLNSFDKLSKK